MISFENLVGLPYEFGARGPDAFDCWGLVAYIYKEALGIELPPFLGYDTLAQYARKMNHEIFKQDSDWLQVGSPEPFCCIGMSKNKTITHVGIWIDSAGVCLHALNGPNRVIAENLQRLKRSRFSNLIFLRYKHAESLCNK